MVAHVNDLFPTTAWRFLLPDPAPTSVSQFGDLVLVVPDSFKGGDFSPGSAELVISSKAETETLQRMFGVAQQGGTCYLQLSPKRWANPARLAEGVSAAGFQNVRVYSLTQAAQRDQISWWMPLGRGCVQSYLLERRSNGGSRPRRLFSRVLHGLSSAFPKLLDRVPWMVSPQDKWTLCIVGVKRDPERLENASTSAGVIPAQIGSAHEQGDALMQLGGSSSDHPIVYVFRDSTALPQAVVKIPMVEGDMADAKAERANLSALANQPGLSNLVPEILGTRSHPEFLSLAQSYVAGTPLSQSVTADNIDEVAAAVIGELVNLAKLTSHKPPAMWLANVIDAALDEADGTLSDEARSRDTDSVVALTRQQLSGLELEIQTCQHRDLGPWNIHFAERNGVETDSVGFIDWSEAVLDGLPVCDAVHFLTHLVLIVDDGYSPSKRAEVLASCIDPNHARGQMIDRCLDFYFDQLGIDADDVGRFRLMTWVLATIKRPGPERPGNLYEQLWIQQLWANSGR